MIRNSRWKRITGSQLVEFADSVGVDIINTSLGYYSFDDPIDNYTYRQLDGHTSLMAASASYAAKKGLLVVCSAGNSGMDEWKKSLLRPMRKIY